ncbi:MAG: hypothetical protein WBW93_19245 [Steroidobacteraceae bacterium]
MRKRKAYLKQRMQDKLIEHKLYIDQHGQDLLEMIRSWKWGSPKQRISSPRLVKPAGLI